MHVRRPRGSSHAGPLPTPSLSAVCPAQVADCACLERLFHKEGCTMQVRAHLLRCIGWPGPRQLQAGVAPKPAQQIGDLASRGP